MPFEKIQYPNTLTVEDIERELILLLPQGALDVSSTSNNTKLMRALATGLHEVITTLQQYAEDINPATATEVGIAAWEQIIFGSECPETGFNTLEERRRAVVGAILGGGVLTIRQVRERVQAIQSNVEVTETFPFRMGSRLRNARLVREPHVLARLFEQFRRRENIDLVTCLMERLLPIQTQRYVI